MNENLKEFNLLENDFQKWEWIKNHQDLGITVFLDNDDTFAILDDESIESLVFQFDEYIGWSEGVQIIT